MENKPESSKDGDGVSQNEEKKQKADKSQDQDISKKLKALDFTKLSTSELSIISEMLKQASTEQEVLEKKSEVIGKPKFITFDGQCGSLEEEGMAAVIQKTDSFTKFKMLDDTMKLNVVKKEVTLKDSPGLSEATRTPQRSAKKTVTYKDTSEESK
jgi:hypothetical protein